VKFLTVKTN